MARAALIAARAPIDAPTRERLDIFLRRLTPDHLEHRAWPAVEAGPDLWIRGEIAQVDDTKSVISVDPAGARTWMRAAIGRVDDSTIEISADPAGARTIWWAKTESRFVASTSQRIIAAALGSFEPNRAAIAWMLSSGTLGPNLAWDRRVQPLAPGGKLILDRRSFSLEVREPPIVFAADTARTDAEHERALASALEEIFLELDFDRERWLVPLSGGFDSRALILLARDPRRHRTITWGTRAALADPRSDACVAAAFAKALAIEHQYFELELSEEPIAKIVHRYVIAGEGRVDHFSGYVDGFRIWRHLRERGIEGIIRGDEGFGWVPVASRSDVLFSVGLPALADYAGAPALHAVGLEGVSQLLPPAFAQRSSESLATWRDRLYHAFRIPTILAALNDLKAPYVEIAAPLLDPRLFALIRAQPDHLRTGKALFKKLVLAKGPAIPYATRTANPDPTDLLASTQMTELLTDELSSARARALLDTTPLLPRNAQTSLRRRATRALKTKAKELLPTPIRRLLRNKVIAHRLDQRTLAFRAFLAIQMHALLNEDAANIS